LHEFAHVIFDLESDQVAIDYKDVRKSSLEEIRAEAFAQEALVPQEVLVQVSSRYGLNWKSLSEAGLAKIAAATHAEPKLILKAAKECGWIDEDQWLAYTMYSCESELKEASEHALSTEEYLHTLAELPPWIASNRQARVGKISVVLPVNYVKRVLEAWEARRIADGKAAEMLFIDKAEFKRRFADTLPDIRSAF
jgi:Zn-dependent peptidase ImmA (M78 family)